MRATLLLLASTAFITAPLVSCVHKDPEDRQGVPPPSANSKIPWNSQGPSGGGAQFGMMPQNKYRR
ncbi:MAG: hypothetical protein J0M04_03225 [Verrucomicrobia bacterium]|nr:hypothetical protein [Verrucomicrobiota bacterium]